jgi:hypothetical protein
LNDCWQTFYAAIFTARQRWRNHGAMKGNLSLLNFAPEETGGNGWLLFLAGGLLGGHGGAFLLAGAAGFGLFLAGLLLN